MSHSKASSVWAITSYYNPNRSRRRLLNYRRFRQSLPLPLITVELSFDGHFDLTAEDADLYHRVWSSTLLWHKESLLNLALKFVPSGVPYVAWIDCDVIFPVPPADWRDTLLRELNRHTLVQIFQDLKDLGADESLREELPPPEQIPTCGISQASLLLHLEDDAEPERILVPPSAIRIALPGIAWAAPVDLMRKHGWYDAMIVGGGDSALFYAALGKGADLAKLTHFSPLQLSHYLAWAEPFFQSVLGNIGMLTTSVIHLWHGNVENRKYMERHQELARLGFDPDSDLTRDSSGLWKWRRPRTDLELFLSQYFQNRQEDGSLRIDELPDENGIA